MTQIWGTCDEAFSLVRVEFERNFAERGEVGAGVSIVIDGQCVVDLTGGVRDRDGQSYDPETLQMVFSTTKGVASMCVHRLAQQGRIDLNAPVASYWPEFGAAGKGEVPVNQLLSHRAGLIDIDGEATLDDALDWSVVTGRLAETAPLWEPGTAHGYHAVTFGWLVGELVRRIDGRSIGTYLAEEIVSPLGVEFYIGLPDEQFDRVAPIIPLDPLPMPDEPATEAELAEEVAEAPTLDAPGEAVRSKKSGLVAALDRLFGDGNLLARALAAPGGAFGSDEAWEDPRVLTAEIPAANGVTNARSLATLYAACVGPVNGQRVLESETLRAAMEPQTSGADQVLMFPSVFGLGFMRDTVFSPLGGPAGVGHYGAGGSVGFCDPDRNIGFGYVMNKMQIGLAGDPRTAALLAAMNESLASL